MSLVKGKAFWVKVQSPDTEYEPKWKADLEVSEEDGAILKGLGMIPRSVEGVPSDTRVQFKRKCEKMDGSKNEQPILVDKDNKRLTSLIGNGSDVIVQYRVYETTYKGKVYQNFDLQGIKVMNLVPYGSPDGAEFGIVEEEFNEDNPFA